MSSNQVQTDRGTSPAKPVSSPLATSIAAIGTFFTLPLVERPSEGGIRDYAVNQYGDWLSPLVAPLWWAICGALLFFGLRAAAPVGLKIFELKTWRRAFP